MSTSGHSTSSRRQFLGATSLVGASLAAARLPLSGGTGGETPPESKTRPRLQAPHRLRLLDQRHAEPGLAAPAVAGAAPRRDHRLEHPRGDGRAEQGGVQLPGRLGPVRHLRLPSRHHQRLRRRGPRGPGEAIDPRGQAARHHLPVRHGALQLGLRSDHPGRSGGPRQEQGRDNRSTT